MITFLDRFRREGSKFNQVLCAILVNLPLLCYGASIGWMSPMTPLLQSPESPSGAPLTDDEISWMAAATFITAVPTVFVFGYLVDNWGRKASLLICSAQFVGCWIIKLCSTEHWAMVMARGLVGSGLAGCYVVTPLYTKEISEDSIRGAMGSLVILSQTVGNLLLYILGDIMSYRTILWICLAVPTLHILVFVYMPESPCFLLRQGKIEETIETVSWLRCRHAQDPVVRLEMEALRVEEQQERDTNKFALRSILTNPVLFQAFRITMVLSIAREVCGTIPVLNFASNIFSMAAEGGEGLVLSPNQQAMMLGVVQVAGSALASSVVEKTGRKPLLFVTSLVSGVGMTVLGSWFLARTLAVQWADWLPITALCVCIFCDASGLQPVSLVVMSEMFAFQYRSTVTSIAMSTVCFFNFLQLRFFKPLATSVGIHVTFYIFGAICLGNAIYIALWVPETKMRKVNEIYQELSNYQQICDSDSSGDPKEEVIV